VFPVSREFAPLWPTGGKHYFRSTDPYWLLPRIGWIIFEHRHLRPALFAFPKGRQRAAKEKS